MVTCWSLVFCTTVYSDSEQLVVNISIYFKLMKYYMY